VDREGDGHRADRPVAQQVAERGQIAVRAEYPRGVGHTALVGGSPSEQQHVGLRIHPDDRPDPRGERQAQLAGTAAEVHHQVGDAEPERLGYGIDGGGRVPAPVPRVVGGHLTAKVPPMLSACQQPGDGASGCAQGVTLLSTVRATG
jgi:hypothetical protein